MKSLAWNHSKWAETPPFGSNDCFPNHQDDTWESFSNGVAPALDVSPPPLTHDSLEEIERSTHAGITLSFKSSHDFIREGSIPVEQLMEEILWPRQQLGSFELKQPESLLFRDTLQPNLQDTQPGDKIQYTPAADTSSILQPVVDPGAGKRKRGRPRLYSATNDMDNFDTSTENISDSRKSQLEKNRVAAERCRQRRKTYTTGLQTDVSVLSSRNEKLKAEEAALREELLSLKNEMLRHGGCNSSIIDGYIAKTANSQLVSKVLPKNTLPRRDSSQELSSGESFVAPRDLKAGKLPQFTPNLERRDSEVITNDSNLFELLNDFMVTEEP